MVAPRRGGVAPVATFDSIILAAVLAECRDLPGASVSRAQGSGPDEIVLSLRWRGRPRALLISAHPRWCRMHLAGDVKPAETTAFVSLLRGRLEGAVLRAINAPRFERLVTLTFETLEGPLVLTVEMMGRHANMILCRDGTIVGALKPVCDRARGREVLPGRPYVRPPAPRTNPASVGLEDLLAAADTSGAGGGTPAPVHRAAWRAVLDATGGIGPAMAWEACLRAGVDPARSLRPCGAAAIAGALQEIGRAVLAAEFAPVLYRDLAGRPAAYAAFPMRAFAALRDEPSSMSAAVAAVTARAADAAQIESVRRGLASTVAQAASRVRRALDAGTREALAADEADRLREHGELILAYLSQIAPSQAAIEVPGFDGRPTRISLDPRLSGVANAQAYFRRYARAAAARQRLPTRRAELEAERAFLETLAVAIEHAETRDDLWEVEQDLIAAGLRRAGRSAIKPRGVDRGRVFVLAKGVQARVGRSARENDRLTFEVARPDDLWLHARGMPGAHVIVAGGRGEPSETVLAAAAAIAAYYSAGRESGKVSVDVTRRRYVRRVRGGRPGQVTYTRERTLVVSPGLPASRDATT